MCATKKANGLKSTQRRLSKSRIDLLLVEQGFVPTREKAQSLLMAGQVMAGDRLVTKPGTLIPVDTQFFLRDKLPYVSRGGVKLAHALDTFQLNVEGKICLDVGSSTGGFTDCLLQHGAHSVYAVDVGYGQLANSLRTDPRVVVFERTNARYPFDLPGERDGKGIDFATVDVSFISLEKILPSVASHLKPGSCLLPLIKPQFQARRSEVGRRGVIRDPIVHADVLARVLRWAVDQGYRIRGLVPSPLLGDAGNREFFLHLEIP